MAGSEAEWLKNFLANIPLGMKMIPSVTVVYDLQHTLDEVTYISVEWGPYRLKLSKLHITLKTINYYFPFKAINKYTTTRHIWKKQGNDVNCTKPASSTSKTMKASLLPILQLTPLLWDIIVDELRKVNNGFLQSVVPRVLGGPPLRGSTNSRLRVASPPDGGWRRLVVERGLGMVAAGHPAGRRLEGIFAKPAYFQCWALLSLL
ncbi:unnamed protein product [Sphenostylis stenocarpa]|uniref:Uncharacterized protein n=1 Tax=Sphenostylis stenocarpa TaxID=92480 RepID=A0AA86W2B2_9FABA|nr:unnamed protein product [Sphenostylis stenocarpa]